MEGESKNDSQRVVLVHDASGGVRANAVRWILDGFMLKAGDIFVFLSVIHQVHHPMGYKVRVDNSMFGGTNQKIIDDEIARKKKEHDENLELVQISKLYEMQKIEFKIELVVGPIPKTAAVEASKKCNATWVILDRRIKTERKYFLEKLSCGISRMKRNDEILKIRGPKISTASNPKISYDEMLPVDHELHTRNTQNDDDLFSIELGSSCTSSSTTSTRNSISDGMLTLGNISQDDKIKQSSSMFLETFGKEHKSPLKETSRKSTQTPPMSLEKLQFDQKKCTTCNSTRPTNVWQSRTFSYSEIVDATNRFSSENLIYRGEHEAVFSGTLKRSKLNVIIKQQKDMKKYSSEMQALEKTRHENVIMLLGICVEKIPILMVFECACNGSLDQHLSHQRTRPLTWTERMTIAIGASRGLQHLHAHHIIHGDIRPKNILLTHDFEPLIAGFGLAKTKNEKQNSSDHYIIGTFGYMAPEYTQRGKATTKTDVYAFGVVILEIVTSRSPTDTRLKGQSLLQWAIPLVKEKRFSELIDPGIAYDNKQLMSTVNLALECLCTDSNLRLSMEKVVQTLEDINDEKTSHEAHSVDEIEEVNENAKDNCQSQRDFDEKVNFSFGGMTPLPKQANHFYQEHDISLQY